MPLLGKGEDLEVAFAGEDDREEAAVGGDIELADGDAVEEWLRRGREDRDVFEVLLCSENGNIDPDEIAGFSFDGALEHDAVFVGGPVKNTEAYAQADEIIGDGEVPHFQNFAVDEVSDFFAAGRNGETAGVAIKRGDFLVVLRKKFEALEARRAGLRAVLLDGDGSIGARDAIGVNEGAAFERGASRACGDIHVAEGEELARLDGFVEVDDRGIVLKPGGVEAVLDDGLTFAKVNFFAAVFEGEGLEGVLGAAFLDDAGGEKLREDHAAVRRPVEGVDGVGKEFIAVGELVALE